MRLILCALVSLAGLVLPAAAQTPAETAIFIARGVEEGALSYTPPNSPAFRWKQSSGEPLAFSGATQMNGRNVILTTKVDRVSDCTFTMTLEAQNAETQQAMGRQSETYDFTRLKAFKAFGRRADISEALTISFEATQGACMNSDKGASCGAFNDTQVIVLHEGVVTEDRVRKAFEFMQKTCKPRAF